MNRVLQFFVNMDVGKKWTIYSTLFGFVSGIITGYVYYALGKREKKLIRYTEKSVLYPKKMSFFKGLQLSYNGKPVSDFVVSLAEVKNIGKVEIEENDFANRCPLSITTTGEFLIRDSIDAIPIKISNQYSNIHLVSKDEKNINVEYDYLGMGDSFSLTVMHSGDLKVIGILKAGKFRTVDVPVNLYSTAIRRTIEVIVLFMLMPLFIHISAEMMEYNILISLGVLLIYGGIFMIITFMFFNTTTSKRVD